MSYLQLFIFQLYTKYGRHCESEQEGETLGHKDCGVPEQKPNVGKAPTTKAAEILTNHLPLIVFLLILEM